MFGGGYSGVAMERWLLVVLSLVLMLLCGFALGFSNLLANVKPAASNILANPKEELDELLTALAKAELGILEGDLPKPTGLAAEANLESSAKPAVGCFWWRQAVGSILPIDFINKQIEAKIKTANQAKNSGGGSVTGYALAKAFEGVLPWCFWQDNSNPGLDLVELPSKFLAGEAGKAANEAQFFWNKQKEDGSLSIKPVKVGIYSSHSAESYEPFSGSSKVPGKHGGVYVASTMIADTLTAKGIGVVVDGTIHDYPDWNASYSNSLTTASRLLAENSELEILMDVHRDASVPKKNSTVKINGKNAAKIMLVVGQAVRYGNDHWQENLAFTKKIGAKMDERYPGLLKRISVQNGRYNQHLCSRAILAEIGATENTIQEVEYSAKMLAEVLAEILEAQP